MSNSITYIKDKELLKRIGCTSDMYAVYNDEEEQYIDDDGYSCFEDTDDEDYYENIDNKCCNADFESVSDNYHGIKGHMKGALKLYKKDGKYPKLVGIFDKSGMYKMQSTRATVGYLGNDGKAQCLAIPQCKMMNSTVMDFYADHKVYIGKYTGMSKKSYLNFGDSGLDFKDEDKVNKWIKTNHFKVLSNHLSFDLWCLIGAVYGKVLRIWNGVEKMNMNNMPNYITVTISEIFETINPGCKWKSLSKKTKYEWKNNIFNAFSFLKNYGMLYDLPQNEGKRKAFCSRSIIESSWIKRRALGVEEEKRCKEEWGEVWEPFAFKIKIKGSFLFDFCWRRKNNQPSLVQIRFYDYDFKRIFGIKHNSSKVFSIIWASWLIQYRNYWKRKKNNFKTCELVWSKKEMLKGFNGNIFNIKHLTTDEMIKVLEWYTIKGVVDSKLKRPAHIANFVINKRCELIWTLPKSLKNKSVLLKNEKGVNISLEDSGICQISQSVMLAQSRMEGINEVNNKHITTLDGKKISVSESVIYRLQERNGKYEIDDERNGRCYSLANGIQSLKKKDRKRVLIDGNKCKEVDYSSLHPNMLYALNGINYSGKNMYNVGRWYIGYMNIDEARKATKMMLLRMINAKTVSNAIYSFKTAWNEMNGNHKNAYIPWIYDLYESIKKYHKPISHEFCTGKGVYLMNKDGKLIREVCWRLTRENICALGIHDSIIVDEKFVDKAKKIMQEEYFKVFGQNISVES